MSVEIVALYGVSLCLLMPSVSSMLMAVVNLVNLSVCRCCMHVHISIHSGHKVITNISLNFLYLIVHVNLNIVRLNSLANDVLIFLFLWYSRTLLY